ncbi:unnamed protein product [Didymodactylos carnosus]|uniref:Uncharacterized protein n=1 Tax=Didymodactylos carnosus TaxID=1234261 RepID=A0A815J9H8_9BILA|nr:unnamed protein product [Didymodactylos carnosus]CAF4266776.1 unnamed protein product [Didymodactylos carnosus]
MKDGTRLNADKLVDESDKVFQKSNAKDEIFEYITNMLKYMKKVYSNIYESKDTEVQQQCNKKYTELYNQDYKILIEILDELENIFINNTITVNDENYFTKMFKVYLEGNSVELVEINKQVSLPIIMTNLKKLRHSNNLFKNISILIYKISNPKIFITGFKNTLKSENAKYCPKLILSNSLQTEKDNIKAENLTTALGCIGQCPYCGCKCTVNMEKHDAHQSTKHRLLAFNGSFELLAGNKKGFVFDLCNSEYNLTQSKWKERSQGQLSIQDNPSIKERMSTYTVGQGEVTITLAWHDSNDLDLHVTCPCGTDIGPKGKGKTFSNFELRVSTHKGGNVQTYNGAVYSSGEKKFVKVGDYEHGGSISFLEHIKENFKTWSNISIIKDTHWENMLRKAWCQVASKMSERYEFENNTPREWHNLTRS